VATVPEGPERKAALLAPVTALALTTALLSACGGDPPAKASPSVSPSASPAAASTRPEGDWTLVTWTVARSDTKDVQPMAHTLLAAFTPSCASGPCDVAMKPAGAEGTYREPQTPLLEGDTGSSQTVALTWDGKVYTSHEPERKVSCTPVAGKVVPEGYSMTRVTSLTFVPANATTPPRVHGTIKQTAKGTPAGLAKGCTNFEETQSVGGVATGSLDPTTPLVGTYGGSFTSTKSTPAALAPVGSLLWLGPMTVSGSGPSVAITGLAASPGPLAVGAEGWSARTPAAAASCRSADGAVTAKGADATETFDKLRAVALTEDGRPIFTGTWRDRINPNAEGLKAECSLAVYEGRLILVPDGAGR
jgi:hypothetical protein